MNRPILSSQRGSLLILSIILLLVVSISVPALVNWVRQETKETVKVKRTSTAFHMAEAGVDQGIWKLQESKTTWNAAKAGTVVSGYDGGTQYSLVFQDGTTGYYNIKFTSGPVTGQVTILAKGRDPSSRELRALQAVVEENGAGAFAMQAKKTASFGASTGVEWGPVIAKTIITSGGKNHPRLMTSSDITGKDTTTPPSAEPNTDGYQWWSFMSNLPPEPVIDFEFYKSSAQAAGAAPAGCGNGSSGSPSTHYIAGNAEFRTCNETLHKVFYVTGSCDFVPNGGGNSIIADVICLQGITAGNAGAMTETLTVPPDAWKEYGNDFSYYRSNFDPTCPYNTGNSHTDYDNAEAANYYRTGLTKSVSDIIVHGFLYAGGSAGLSGGGNSNFVGALYSANDASLTTSNFTFYYDPAVAASIQTTNVIITRESWKEVVGVSWP